MQGFFHPSFGKYPAGPSTLPAETLRATSLRHQWFFFFFFVELSRPHNRMWHLWHMSLVSTF